MLEDRESQLSTDVVSVPGVDECFELIPGKLGRVMDEELLSRWWSCTKRYINWAIDIVDGHGIMYDAEVSPELFM
jgi:hypothetical protein